MLVFCGLLFFTTKRFACWMQDCFWGLREGVAGLCVAVLCAACCGGNTSGRIVMSRWVYVGAICKMKPCVTGYSW